MSYLIGHHNPLSKLKSNNYPKKETTPQILSDARVTIRANKGNDWTKTTAKDLYHVMMAREKITSRIRIKFHERNHEQIFKNCTNQYLPAPVRDHVFRKIHDLLPTKQRLKRCGYVKVDGCPDCGEVDDADHHIFCSNSRTVLNWIKRKIYIIRPEIEKETLTKLTHFDFKIHNDKKNNAVIWLLASMSLALWKSRKKSINNRTNLTIQLVNADINNLKQKRYYIKHFEQIPRGPFN